ncbi:MAG TPA: HAMP domain-containing sensor histidine kinase [Polyangiaceae bacterium]|nr:HAMP domain-containing sensor histidine kinase [Polyangiaceae bacterium]
MELVTVLEEATSMLRHDVRNRLGSIRNMAYFVAKRVADSEPAKKDARINQFLQKIEAEVEWTDQLIDRWSAIVARVQERRVSTVTAAKVVELALSSARIAPEVKLDVVCEDALLEADVLELAHGLRCLIENAAEALGAGSVRVEGRPQDGGYSLRVRDAGPGIADQKLALQQLSSTKPGHLGVGLCIVQRLAQRVGGKLSIHAPERGAEVELFIPLAGSGTHVLDET